MNFSLHMTDDCNMDCAYCVREKHPHRMTKEIVDAACRLAFSNGKTAGLCYFGGEPMLEKELICHSLDLCEKLSEETGKPFSCKMTTNGTLLDEKFIQRAKEMNMVIAVSFDGTAQDITRRYKSGNSTFETLVDKSKLLLSAMPYSIAMMTVSPKAADKYYESVKFLRSIGFYKIYATIAYGNKVHWTDDDLEVLREQLLMTADMYAGALINDEKFIFGPFDAKISECISGKNPNDRCHLGFRQMPIAPDGKLYPCTQFIGKEEYCIGNVFDGIDTAKQLELIKRSAFPEKCAECDLRTRCTNSCGCTNMLETGNENLVSPLQCTYERMLIDIADKTADRIFEKAPEKFKARFAPLKIK